MTAAEIYKTLGVSGEVLAYGEKILETLCPRFAEIDARAEINQAKVLAAMQKNRVNATHFAASTGYGYDDEGRDNLERVYADAFHTEAALVRPQITCGTHALAVALSANLLPGDELLAISGKPYDTLEEVIGIRPSPCSLKEYGVSYRQVDLLPGGGFDYDGIRAAINEKTKLITIQRSKGYATRPSYSVEEIGKLIAFCKECKPDVLCMVDNCYGEFVETQEPTNVGADMVVGSLIKNLGGGLAPTGGYVCGRKECIERCAYRLSAPGLGREVGANLGLLTSFYQGLFLAPTVVSSAVRGAVFAAGCYEKLGFRVAHKPDSQEICFVPDQDYAGFIERTTGKPSKEGNFVTADGTVLGRHKGIIHYTIGQRKGLGLAMGRRVVVTEIRPETNEVVIGEQEDVFTTTLYANRLNYMSEPDFPEGKEVLAKIRYNHKGSPCVIRREGADLIRVDFREPVRAVTPGQAVVFYDGDYVLGGGTIIRS